MREDKELRHLALTIILTDLYVSETSRLLSDIESCLPTYRQRRKELLRRRAKRRIHQHGESVLSTWEVGRRSGYLVSKHNGKRSRGIDTLASVGLVPLHQYKVHCRRHRTTNM